MYAEYFRINVWQQNTAVQKNRDPSFYTFEETNLILQKLLTFINFFKKWLYTPIWQLTINLL